MTAAQIDASADLPFCAVGDHPARWQFRFTRGPAAGETRCLRHAVLYRPLIRTAVLTALVVGTILTAINHGNVLLGGDVPAALYWKVPLTYSVPYMVATWSAMRMAFVRR